MGCGASIGHPNAVLDLRIPGTGEYYNLLDVEAARAILAQEAVPIVFLTAYPDEDFVRRAGDAGAMAYLLKPVNESTLRSTIEVALARFTELGALRREVNDLKEALETRKLVEKAKGVLMKRVQLSEAEAFRRMQQKSRTTRTSLKVIASTIVQADDLLSPFEETP